MKQVAVTDHAVLRYMERVQGFDIEAVRRHIAATCGPAIRSGAGCLRTEGVKFQFKAGKVITITPQHGPLPNATRIAILASRAPA